MWSQWLKTMWFKQGMFILIFSYACIWWDLHRFALYWLFLQQSFMILGIPQLCFLDFFRDYPDNSSRSCSFTWGMMIPQLFDCEDFWHQSLLLRIDKSQICPMGFPCIPIKSPGFLLNPLERYLSSPAESSGRFIPYTFCKIKKLHGFSCILIWFPSRNLFSPAESQRINPHILLQTQKLQGISCTISPWSRRHLCSSA